MATDPQGFAASRPVVDDHPNRGPHTECLVDHGGKGVRRHCRRGCKWPCPDESTKPERWHEPRPAARMFSRREVWFVEHLAWLVPRALRTRRPFRRYYWQKDQLDRINAEAAAWRQRLGLDGDEFPTVESAP